jgi:hypothetical protein
MKVEKSSATFHVAGSCGTFLGCFSHFLADCFSENREFVTEYSFL